MFHLVTVSTHRRCIPLLGFHNDRDIIDHKSLAEYFSTDRDGEYPKVSASGPGQFHFEQLRNGFAGTMNHIALTSRKAVKDR